jgi:hypothetical protein
MNIQETLKAEFNGHISFRERRPHILQVLAPLYHEDGDMVDVYLDLPQSPNGLIRISDHGMTLMRLSYSYEIDTPTKRRVLERILSENGVSESQGRLYMEAAPKHVYPSLLQFAQTVAKVSNMRMFKREVIQNLFYETLNDFVLTALSAYRPQAHYLPIPDRDDLDVDWRFPLQNRDIYLYGVRDAAKARLVGLTCLEYQKMEIPFRSVIIHEDFENGLSKKDQRRITNIADKQFATFPDFAADADKYFVREAAMLSLN